MVYPELFASKVLDNTIPRTLRRDLSLTSRPTTVLRKATVSLVQQLQGAKQLKVVLEGRTGSGRSTVLLQTVAACQVDGYLILHIPDGTSLINSTTFIFASSLPDCFAHSIRTRRCQVCLRSATRQGYYIRSTGSSSITT